MAVGIRCADHVTPLYPQKLALTSPTGGGRSVGIVRLRTKATEFFFRNEIWTILIDPKRLRIFFVILFPSYFFGMENMHYTKNWMALFVWCLTFMTHSNSSFRFATFHLGTVLNDVRNIGSSWQVSGIVTWCLEYNEMRVICFLTEIIQFLSQFNWRWCQLPYVSAFRWCLL